MIIVTPGNCKRICKALKKRKNKAARPAATGQAKVKESLAHSISPIYQGVKYLLKESVHEHNS